MKQRKSRRKKKGIKQSLKHVVNVSRRQKPYRDYSRKVVVSFFFVAVK